MARVTVIRRRVPDGAVGFSAYARLLEEAATTASSEAGYPPRWYAEQATAWVIRRSTIECPEPLETGCELEISTWVADFRRVRSRREYVARTPEADAVALTAHTDWVYVDRTAGAPRRIPEEMMRAFVPEGAIATLPRGALELPQAPADAGTIIRDVDPAAVDALDHVNNAEYFDYVEQSAMAVLGTGFRPRRHDLEYLAEARGGERLLCRSWRLPGNGAELDVATEIQRARDGTPLTRSRSTWTARERDPRALIGPGRQRGFTLLEIMVTLAILGVVFSIVYGVFTQTIAGKELAERRGDEASSARAALGRIAQDLQNARPQTVGPPPAQPSPPAGTTPTPTPTGPTTYVPDRGLFLGRVRTESGVPLDDVAFTTWLRRPTAVTFAAIDFGIVHYFVAPLAPESETFGLYREAILSLAGDFFDPDQANPANSTLILAGVTGFDVRFFDGQDWIQEWDSTDSRNFARAPLAVEVTLGVTNERGETETYETAIDVPLVRDLKRPQVPGRPTPRQ